MLTGTMLVLVRRLICTSPGLVRPRWDTLWLKYGDLNYICLYQHHPFTCPLTYSQCQQKEDDGNSGSGHPPKKKPTRLAIGECISMHVFKEKRLTVWVSLFPRDMLPPLLFLFFSGIEGGFDVEQEQYEEDVKVVILPDRQEVTSEDLATMPDVVRERVRGLVCFLVCSGFPQVVCMAVNGKIRCALLISNVGNLLTICSVIKQDT